MRLTLLYSTFLSIILVYGCKAFDKEEPIPSYIYIEKIDLTVKPGGVQGTNAHDIKDAWILANGELIGVFELPCRVPILKSGETEIIIFAGIKVNGQSNNRKFYPFYDVFKQTVNLQPTVIDTLKPNVTYKEEVKFVWIVDFEDMAVSLKRQGLHARLIP